MIAELIFVGTELLLGQVQNTNAQFLSGRLAAAGVDVYRQVTVGDNLGRLQEAVRTALGRADAVILSGGLGPTSDDVTREAVAAALGRPLVDDVASRKAIEAFFASAGRRMSPNNLRQALVPEGGRPIPNPYGTAPGLKLRAGGKLLFLLPGPPNEFQPMVDAAVVPALLAMQPGGAVIVSRLLRLCGIGEADVEARLEELIGSQAETTIAPLASPGEVVLRLTAKAETEEAARAKIAPVEREIRRILGGYVYGTDRDSLPAVICSLLGSSGRTLAAAESCTGGLLADRLTDVPGASERFLGGVVAYTNGAKARLLGVPVESIRTWGPVSGQVCGAMAEAVKGLTGADLGIATTGIAGPGGGTERDPVGSVFIGLAWDKDVAVTRHRFSGDRRTVKARAVRQALVVLRDHLLEVLSAPQEGRGDAGGR